MKSKLVLGTGMLLSAALLVGCENTREGVERDAEDAAAASERAAERSAETAREAGREAGEAIEGATEAAREGLARAGEEAREAGAATAEAAREAGAIGDAAQQTAQIKSALMADTTIDSTGIDVDTNAGTRTVTLRGHVKSAAEKARAASIAAAKAPGYRVTNALEVGE